MTDIIKLHYEVEGDNFDAAGKASANVKKTLRQLGFKPEIIRRASIAMYEGEMNMVIHANGGTADIEIFTDRIKITLTDRGPGIPDIDKAMEEGYSTASDLARERGFGAGMGLPNMKKYTDDMVIKTVLGVGTTIEMKVDINGYEG